MREIVDIATLGRNGDAFVVVRTDDTEKSGMDQEISLIRRLLIGEILYERQAPESSDNLLKMS